MKNNKSVPVYMGWMALVLVGGLFLSGCVVKDIGRTIEHTVKGDYYLQTEKYEQGRQSFQREVREEPDSALAHYYYGRFLLQDGAKKEALVQLKKSRDLDPENADFHFWTGVAFSENGDNKSEELSYRAALKVDAKHLQALIYLGHNLLEKKKYQESLDLYTRALEIWPGSPSSLYNRALILRRLGRTPEERQAWLEYLALYPTGGMARRATEHLNSLNDFTYRNHTLGVRTVTTEKIWFEPLTAKLSSDSKESLNLIGSVVNTMKKGTLQVVTFQKNNRDLAHLKAVAIKRFLLEAYPEIGSGRIKISWFAEPQKIVIRKKNMTIDESVSFFITDA